MLDLKTAPIYGPGGWVEVSVIYKASSEAKNVHWLPWIQNENTFLPEKSCTLWQMWSDLVQLQAFLLNVLPHIQLALLFHITYLPIHKYIYIYFPMLIIWVLIIIIFILGNFHSINGQLSSINRPRFSLYTDCHNYHWLIVINHNCWFYYSSGSVPE